MQIEFFLTVQIASITHPKIKCAREPTIGHIRPQLLLQVNGSFAYNAHRTGSHDGGGHAQLSFMVAPCLPNNLEEVRFALVPYGNPMENPPKEIILDQEIYFS